MGPYVIPLLILYISGLIGAILFALAVQQSQAWSMQHQFMVYSAFLLSVLIVLDYLYWSQK